MRNMFSTTHKTIYKNLKKIKKKLNFDLSLSTHPQPLNCGEVCVWGAGSDSVSGNYALKIDEGEKIFPEVNSVYDCNHPSNHTGITAYIQDESVTHKLTCSSEASHHCVGQLASSNETYTHPTCETRKQRRND